jgi:Xaa-Pro aminopeptidase
MSNLTTRLKDLRAELKTRGLSGFVVPLTDEHQSEYIAPYTERMAWLTGFLGSFGCTVVLAEKAAVVSDGRYAIQINEQVDGDNFDRVMNHDKTHIAWLAANAKAGDKVGYDPFLHTVGWVKQVTTALVEKDAELVAVDSNPIDSIWPGQPKEPTTPVTIHDDKLAGESSASKRARIAKIITDKGCDAVVLTALDSIAWMFNVRSTDVTHNPVSYGYAIIRGDETGSLYIHEDKITPELRQALGNVVDIVDKKNFLSGLENLGAAKKTVLVDPTTASAKVFGVLEDSGATVVRGDDPCSLPKAIKNDVEVEGSRQAHIRDGFAISKYLHWLSVTAHKETEDEISAANKLLAFRQEDDSLRDLSFRTISGAGPNGALCHYSVSEETNRKIENNSVYLCDSGGQYPDGTTDITRTVAVGDAGAEARDRFTRVLKGHIMLARAVFPEGTTGPQLDTLARIPLWEVGLDYDHGTGHGVGSYLAVHEGPGRISKAPNDVALQPGMIFSNEPGYYKEGAYGFRVENLVVVKEVSIKGAERKMFGFEELTFAPLDKNLTEVSILSDVELDWLNDYHARVWDKISPGVTGDVKAWLKEATDPLTR